MATIDIQQARRYLQKVAPINEDGYITIHRLTHSSYAGKKTLPGNAHKSIDTALEDLKYWVAQDVDTYLCLGSTAEAKKQNGPYLKGDRKSKFVCTKSLWLDIDVKDGAYATEQSAKTALMKFIISAKLHNPSLIVSSGTGGMHVYWVCTRFINAAEFDVMSKALAALTKKHGLICDVACTKDKVRVFRPSGTFNFKNGDPLPVKTLYMGNDYEFSQLEQMLRVEITKDSKSDNKIDDDDILDQMPTNTFAPSDIDQVAKACPFIANTLKTGGAGYSEPLWTNTVMLATYCTEPQETAIKLSRGHEKYLEDETIEKVRYHINDHQTNKKVGPPKCQTMYSNGAKECATCAHLSLNKNPLNVPGAHTPMAQFQNPKSNDLPPGYYRGQNNHIYTEIRNKEGEKVPLKVFPYNIVYNSAWVEPNCVDYALNFITYEEGNKEKHISVSYTAASTEDQFKRTLASAGLPLPRYTRETREFMLSFQEMLRSRAGGMIRDEPIGWTMKGGEFEAFSYDGQYFSASINHAVPKLKGTLAQHYTPMGSIQPWLELSQVITEQKRPALNVLLLSGFAAPLVAMTGHSGIILGGYSPETGIGKSTAIEVSTAIWGHPINSRCGLNDTVNMAVRRAAQTRHLPLNWDEVKTKQQFTNLSNIIFQMTEGREKGRLNRTSEEKDIKDFQTLLLYASNASVIEAIQEGTKGTMAGTVRDFEFRVPKYATPSQHATIEVQNLQHKLKSNYGMVGLEYAKYLGQNGRGIHQGVVELQTSLETRLSVGRDERFWVAAMTSILSAARIAKSQKWVDVDMLELFKFLEKEFYRMRNKKNKSPTDFTTERATIWLLAQYISANRHSNMVIVNKLVTGVGRPPVGSIEMEGQGTSKENFLRQINIVMGRENKMIRFTDSSFGYFCRSNDIPVGAARDGLRNNLGATLTNARITAGLGLVSAGEPCWLIRLEGTPYEKMFEI